MRQRVLFRSLIATLAVCVAGFVLNFGWMRFAFGFFAIPALLLMAVNQWLLARSTASPASSRVAAVVSSNVLTALAFVVLPDGGDVGGTYAVFGLVPDPPEFLTSVAIVSFFAGLLLNGVGWFLRDSESSGEPAPPTAASGESS